MIHDQPHPNAGCTVTLSLAETAPDIRTGDLFVVEDWADRVFGRSWGVMDGNPTAMKYAIRSGLSDLPTDDEVLYGKVAGFAHLIHVSEIEVPA